MQSLNKRLLGILPILAVIGPGIISGAVSNDAGSIATYSLLGAKFGYSLLWILLLITFSLAVTQEIGIRLGLVTGKGLGGLIREKYGLRWATFIMACLLIANIGVLASEFAGVASALEIFNIPRIISVLLVMPILFLLIIKGNYNNLRKIFLFASGFYIVYIFSAFLSHPDWNSAFKGLVTPAINLNKGYLLAVIALLGTTISPWTQFFIQDYAVDKKLTKDDLPIEKADVYSGSIASNIISFFIIIACAATIFMHKLSINDAKDAARALAPLAGKFSALLFAFGLLNASLFGGIIVPVSTSYVISETLGFESGLNKSFKNASMFYIFFVGSILIGGLIVILPFLPLLQILFITQALNAVLLIPILIFLYLLSNDSRLLGNYRNKRVANFVLGATIIIIFVASVITIIYQV